MTRTAVTIAMVLMLTALVAQAQTAPDGASDTTVIGKTVEQIQQAAGPGGTVKALLAVTVLAVAPALVVMVTSFTRIIIVLGLLRQALGTHQLPPNQILFGLALLMSVVVMGPIIADVQQDAIGPYSKGEITQADAWQAGQKHIRNFMIRQIEQEDNVDDVYLFLSEDQAGRSDLVWKDVGTESLIGGFVVSELKTAFLMGFRIYLPFLIIDMLVASSLLSMGMLMLPPMLVSLPFKLLLFVLADGWHLVVGTLMRSFG